MSSPILSSLFIPRVLFLLVVPLVVLAGFVTMPFDPVSGKVSRAEALTDVGQVTRERSSSAALFSTTCLFSVDEVEMFPGFLAENGRPLFSLFVTASRPIAALTYSAPFSPPTVSLTTPTNNAKFIAGSTVIFAANASAPDGTVSKVEFFQGAVKLGEDTTAPYEYQWTNVPAADYVITARATDNVGENTVSAPINIAVLGQVKQYVGWSSITNGTDLDNGSLRKTSTGAWDFWATSLQTLLPGDGYFESTAANYNQSVSLVGSNGLVRGLVIGSGGWVGIYEDGQDVADTSPLGNITPHAAGDRYRLEIVNGVLRYIRYRSGAREVMFTSAGVLPAYPMTLAVGMSPQNAEWQKSVLAQLTRKATWTSITNGIDLGNGWVRKTSTGAWDFSAAAAQTLVRGDGYFESTASYFNHSIALSGIDGQGRALIVGTGGWAAIYENGQEVANTYPLGNITAHAAGDRYRLEIVNGALRYVRYRSGVRAVLYTSTSALPAYPLSFGLGASFQNTEWQDTVIAQLSQNVSWDYIVNGIDLGNGSVRNTSNGVWDFGAGPKQKQFYGSGYFESTSSYYNHSITLSGANGQAGTLLAGTGGWAAIYEGGQEVANTYPLGNITPHAAGDRYRLELTRGKLRYVRYRAGARSILFTSINSVPTNPIVFNLGASFQNSEWQNTIFSDNVPELNNALFVSQTVPATMLPGQNYNVSVTFRNNGASTWTPDGDYQLASENLPDNLRWGLNRVDLTTTVLPGSDATFNFTVTAPPTGSHSFQWRMVQQGVERFGALSTNINVQTVNGAPSVSLTSPAHNATFTAGATIPLSANASDSDGTISKVEFFQGAVKLGEDTTSPYTFNWTNVPAGSYVLTAKATDNGGATTVSVPVNITVNAANESPTVTLTSPSNNAVFTAPATVALSANAADSDGVINKVEFFQGATKLGEDTSAPYNFNWTNVAAGSYLLTARATDNLGAVTTSSPINIIVNQPPTVSLTNPANNAVFTAIATVPFSANASDTDGTISKVEFFQGATKLGEDTTAPYNFNWTNVAAGSYVLTARATDNLGAVTTSSSVNIVVNQPPTASLTGPANNAVFTATATVPFSANASDTDGTISKVEFFQGATKLGEDTTAPYNFNWTNVAAGSYALTAKATDDRSAVGTSTVVNITVNAPPVANAGGPYTGTVGTPIQFNGSGSDADGSIVSYQWNFGDGGTASVASPTHSYAAAGPFTATLTVTDNLSATGNATASVSVSDGIIARLDPSNRTGGRGEDPLSRNYNWNVSLLSLSGRAGLDLNLSLAYNSLATWTRNGSAVSYDDDHGVPGPGFRLGFPVIQSRFFNSAAGKFAFLLIGPDGARVELRQVGSSSHYQSVDSSYMLLDATSETAMTLRTTNGTQLAYVLYGSDFQCTQIKDRNGNFITANYDTSGRLTSVIDTLNRTINLDYDSNGLKSITQAWTGQPQHVWASFTYENRALHYNYPNLTVTPADNSTIHVLKTVTLNDGTHYDFEYTTWGQIWKITCFTPGGQMLNYRAYNLPGDLPPMADCPRFTEKHDWAQNWNRNSNGVETEVDGQITLPSSASWTMPDGLQQTGVVVRVNAPDGTYQKFYFAGSAGTPSGWQRSQISLMESYDSASLKQRWTFFSWTQDATNVSYAFNPRLTETNTYDAAGNRARKRIEFDSFDIVGDGTTINLARDTYEYQANASTVLRRAHTEYKMTTPYTDRRLIGLVREETLYEGPSPGTLVTQAQSEYDEGGSIQGNETPVRHDNSYDQNFVVGRGNLSSVKRINVNTPSQFTINSARYNTSGSVVSATDPNNHEQTISFADVFSDGVNRNTLAYPTTMNDAQGYSSLFQYNYDFGAPTQKQTPLSNTTQNVAGPAQTLAYDSLGRVQQVTNLANNSYTRYEYPTTGNRVDSYATIEDGQGEAHSIQISDGLGRPIASAISHPGSDGGFSGELTIYDKMGRVVKASNPTETNTPGLSSSPYNWPAIGDDTQTGWIYTEQTYDWKGRPLVRTNPSITENPAQTTTRQISYEGCGCAGGEVTTLIDEMGRQQKTYSDVLGRSQKIEVLTVAGNVYSSTVNTYNARDQLTTVRQFQGAAPSDPNDLSCPGTNTVVDTIVSDSSWRVTEKASPGWDQLDFDDSGWSDAVEEGAYGTPPWEQYTGFPANTPAQWIWSYDTRKADDHTQTLYFRKTFTASTASATLTMQGDEGYAVSLNGQPLTNGNRYMPAQKAFLSLIPGETYVLAGWVGNEGGPGGLLAHLEFNEGICEQTTMSYDGLGRLHTQHTPEQDANTATTYDYYPNDLLMSVVDSRNAGATYSYTARNLVQSIVYSAPAPILATPNLSFTYDAAGNRLSMVDAAGSVTYGYNSVGKMNLETRSFYDLGTSFPISYTYNLSGQLKTITHGGSTASYTYDAVGRTKTVNGPAFLGSTEYVSNILYRASGSYKKIVYGDGMNLSLTYDGRMQLKRYQIQNQIQGQWYDQAVVDHQYYNDGQLRYAHDVVDERFDRAYGLDGIGRLALAYSGEAARDYVNQPSSNAWGPYSQSYQYDVWNRMTYRNSAVWSRGDLYNTTYRNGRNQDTSWQYDADGNIRFDKDKEFKYDANGTNTILRNLSDNTTVTQTVDGDDNLVKRNQSQLNSTTYYVRSSVLKDKIVAEYDSTANMLRYYFYVDGQVLATRTGQNLRWRHEDPLTGSRGESSGGYEQTVEPDSTGVNVGFTDPYYIPPEQFPDPDLASIYTGVEFGGRCRVNGIIFDCAWAQRMLSSGSAVQCPNNDCNARPLRGIDENGKIIPLGWAIFRSGGWWVGDGESKGEYLDEDDLRFGSLLAAAQMPFSPPPPKKEGKSKRVRKPKVDLPTKTPVPFERDLKGKLTIENFNAAQELWIRYELDKIMSPKCAAAYKAEKLKSPSEIRDTRGIVIRPSSDIARSAEDLHLDAETYRDAQAHVYRGQGSTVYGTDGTLQIFLRYDAFHTADASWGSSFFSLGEVLKHEIIHEGIREWYSPWHPASHDLRGFPGYFRIMNGCK